VTGRKRKPPGRTPSGKLWDPIRSPIEGWIDNPGEGVNPPTAAHPDSNQHEACSATEPAEREEDEAELRLVRMEEQLTHLESVARLAESEVMSTVTAMEERVKLPHDSKASDEEERIDIHDRFAAKADDLVGRCKKKCRACAAEDRVIKAAVDNAAVRKARELHQDDVARHERLVKMPPPRSGLDLHSYHTLENADTHTPGGGAGTAADGDGMTNTGGVTIVPPRKLSEPTPPVRHKLPEPSAQPPSFKLSEPPPPQPLPQPLLDWPAFMPVVHLPQEPSTAASNPEVRRCATCASLIAPAPSAETCTRVRPFVDILRDVVAKVAQIGIQEGSTDKETIEAACVELGVDEIYAKAEIQDRTLYWKVSQLAIQLGVQTK